MVAKIRQPKQEPTQQQDDDPFSAPGDAVDGVDEQPSPPVRTRAVRQPAAAPDDDEPSVGDRQDAAKGTVVRAPAAQEKRSPQGVPQGVQRIIESVFQVDHDSTWKRIHDVLRKAESSPLGNSNRKALEVVDDCYREAHKLYCSLKLEFLHYEQEVDSTVAAMRSEASSILEGEKEQGTRKKAITEADVKAKMIELHPDEFRSSERDLQRFKLAVEHAQHMVDVLKERSRTLKAIAHAPSTTADD